MPAPEPEASLRSFAGLLLVAHPSLKDPNFRRAVIFLSMHDADTGAFGFVINRPLGKNAAELLPGHDDSALLERVPVYLGGPVGHDQLGFAELGWDGGENIIHLQTNLSLEDAAGRLADQPGRVRAFVGYAGWSPGQLEGELAQDAWVLTKPTRDTLKPAGEGALWLQIMNSLGPMYKLLAAAPDDPSLN